MAFDKLSYTIPSSSESLLPLFDNAPFYYIEQPKQLNTTGAGEIPNFASFCQVTEQPKYRLKYYKNLHDQTDESVLKNQSHVMSVDDMLYILSDDGLLRAYNMTFEDESQNPLSNVLELYHIHEVFLNVDKILPQELALGDYVKLLYEESNHMMLVVSSKITFALSLDFDQRHTWMKPIKLEIPIKDYIVRADIVDGFLYILRTFNSLEIWNVSNITDIELVDKVNLNLILGAKSSDVIMTDFDVNDGFLALIDKNSKTLYIYDVGSPYNHFSTQLIFSSKLVATPKSLFLYANKVLVLTEGEVHDNILEEFELFENKTANFLRQTTFAGDLNDIVVGEVYVMLAFDDRVELFPHFYTEPMFAPQVLKFVDNINGIQSIHYFDVIWESHKNESDYFIMMIEGEITVAKVQAMPASLSCDPQNVKPGLYLADLVMYEVDCPILNEYCNSSQIIKKHELLEVFVSTNGKTDGFLGQKIYRSDGTKMLFLGILCGLVLGAGLASLLCIMYMRTMREKNKHVKLTEQVDKQMTRTNETANIPERVMSQDDLVMQTSKEGIKLLSPDSKPSI